MDRKTTEQLNEMSKQVYGTSSRWKKLVEKGAVEYFERDREVIVPDQLGRLKKKVFTDKKGVLRRYTVEEVTKLMQNTLDQRKALKEALDKEVGPAAPLESNQT